jgi:hypothetical protein
MTPSRAVFVLRWLLVVNGGLTLLALLAVFMPTASMDHIHRENLGLGPLPEGPIVQYLARSLSFFYAAFGSLTLLLAWDLNRFAPIVTWWGVSALILGCILFWVDSIAGMPEWWKWGEVLYTLFTGALVLLLQRLSIERPEK